MRVLSLLLTACLIAFGISGCGGKDATVYIPTKPNNPHLAKPQIKNCATEPNTTEKLRCKLQNYVEYKEAYMVRDDAIDRMTK